MRVKYRWALAVAGLAVAVTVTGALLWRPAAPQATARPVNPASELEQAAQQLRQRLARLPGDAQAWADLGMTHVQLARITADPAHQARAEQSLRESLRVRPDGNEPALTGLAALAAARHDFTTALEHARQAVAADAYSATAYGVLADALTELGRYEDAADAVQQMLDLRPDTASYSRASYVVQLRGDDGRARELMQMAVQTAGEPSQTAFALLTLAELSLGQGDVAAAQEAISRGLALYPDHEPLLAARAKTRAAQGDLTGAEADLRAVVARRPFAGYLRSLAEVLTAAGKPAEAQEQHALIRAVITLSPPDVDTVMFEAEHGDPQRAVAVARTLHEQRPSIVVADALAWALHLAGDDTEALTYADAALRLGTNDASMRYHRAVIQHALGNRDAARADLEAALRINPTFCLTHTPRAKDLLARLGDAT